MMLALIIVYTSRLAPCVWRFIAQLSLSLRDKGTPGRAAYASTA
jgi:hypothetical protein